MFAHFYAVRLFSTVDWPKNLSAWTLALRCACAQRDAIPGTSMEATLC